MSGNVKYTNILFLVKRKQINCNQHTSITTEITKKRDFNTLIMKGRYFRFGYILLLDSQGIILGSYLPLGPVFSGVENPLFWEPLCMYTFTLKLSNIDLTRHTNVICPTITLKWFTFICREYCIFTIACFCTPLLITQQQASLTD